MSSETHTHKTRIKRTHTCTHTHSSFWATHTALLWQINDRQLNSDTSFLITAARYNVGHACALNALCVLRRVSFIYRCAWGFWLSVKYELVRSHSPNWQIIDDERKGIYAVSEWRFLKIRIHIPYWTINQSRSEFYRLIWRSYTGLGIAGDRNNKYGIWIRA